MKRIPPFRRYRLEFEGCAPRHDAIVAALACHKGDASTAGDTTSDTQSGAQTQGVNAQGTGNKSNTGTEVGNLQAAANDTVIKAGGNVTTTGDTDALSVLQNVLAGVQNDYQQQTAAQNVQGALDALAPLQAVTSANTQPGPVTSGFNLSTNEILTAAAAIGALGLVLLLRKHN